MGDQLIRADRRLALALDGVYRRGEIYLRWLQRLSSVPFATAVGRFLTRFLVLPLGIAYVALEGLQHLINEVAEPLADMKVALLHPEIPLSLPGWSHSLEVSLPVLVLGVFIFGLLHVPSFRRLVGWTLLTGFRGLRGLLVDLPAYVLRLPAVRAVLESRPFVFLLRFVFKPLLVTVPAYLVLRGCALQGVPLEASAGAVFVVTSLFLNTRLGRDLEELLTDWLVRIWQHLSFALLPALLRFTLALFRRLVEGVDRWLYRVDEWLRFRKGESRWAAFYKPVLGFFWFFITYFVRVWVNLFIEPTINPIKHFPVVTVAGKVLAPFYKPIFKAVEVQLALLGKATAFGVALISVGFLPGFFGFLVWELKENWRLYQANRPRQLGPVLIGHHGETMTRLLRPGFHSGTLPKLWTRLRRAERATLRGRRHATARKRHEDLHHVEECLRHFIERELLFLLNESQRFDGHCLTLSAIRLSTNRIAVAIGLSGTDEDDLELVFEELEGWLVAGIPQPGWSAALDGVQRQALETALAGLYKKAGVDLVREPIEALLGTDSWSYTVVKGGLLLQSRSDDEVKVICSLTDDSSASDQVVGGSLAADLPALPAKKLLYKNMPLTWADWVARWEMDAGAAKPGASWQGMTRLLPKTQ